MSTVEQPQGPGTLDSPDSPPPAMAGVRWRCPECGALGPYPPAAASDSVGLHYDTVLVDPDPPPDLSQTYSR